ncbi:DegT/DnrJ/EryC1/StrS family aminotransferase [Paenibacillus eucommiae]|uniref:8-amino-3,8-dideoxy-alpha-D-manno-octulosonate transaminase n=1 Tax=Paenibacillus eucommiae TaxID=1355755 RepID=A0ABS4IWL1_9BACL|nr:DegT/DnrJ/EryC1/StrS family aminotransferase [Paenibacillus eucommiae]MBP1991974.1 8-amino-3,8-dideoxy-alpha-D-manno-octulosonate transaminase [Paenibacillus eucommiae]
MRTIALHGGTPIRSEKFPPYYPGANLMGKEEAEASAGIALSQSPFRYYGVDMKYKVRQFEDMFTEVSAARFSLAVTSGTAALMVSLKALRIGYGDKVAVPACTFIATAAVVIAAGAVPVFVDVDESLNMDPLDLHTKLSEDDEIRAVIAVHILGYPCDMDGIMKVACHYQVPVIEDVAQSCGTTYKGRFCGTIGDIGAFSFQMNKLITCGEGGAVVTNDPDIFERAVRYHDHGGFRDKERYGIDSECVFAFAGQNYRMSEFAGAVMVEQLKKLETIISRMRAHHDRIVNGLAQALPGLTLRKLYDPAGAAGCSVAVVLDSAALASTFIKALNAENINAMPLYDARPLYHNEIFQQRKSVEKNGFPFCYPFKHPLDYSNVLCPRAEHLAPRMVFIPITSVIPDHEIEPIIEGIISVYHAIHTGK